jgi:hypothetical protein
MIEKPIIDALKADAALAARVTLYAGEPAIFGRLAPEKSIKQYVTVNDTRYKEAGGLVIQRFTLMVDYWAYGTSAKIANEASERIEFVLDNKQFESERYDKIRVWIFSSGWIEDEDPRAIHYNQQFEVRASRKKWICQL